MKSKQLKIALFRGIVESALGVGVGRTIGRGFLLRLSDLPAICVPLALHIEFTFDT
jgi:hypothetical protein